MIQDTIVSDKEFRPSEDIIERLVALRDELYERQREAELEIFWKINSCLYVPKIKI